MATIGYQVEGTLLIVSVSGTLSANEIISVINEYYPNGIIKDVIWDITDGTLVSISQNDFKSIAKAAFDSVATRSRQVGITAYVGDAVVKYSLMRMYSIIAEQKGVRFEYIVFNTTTEARKWIIQNRRSCTNHGGTLHMNGGLEPHFSEESILVHHSVRNIIQ